MVCQAPSPKIHPHCLPTVMGEVVFGGAFYRRLRRLVFEAVNLLKVRADLLKVTPLLGTHLESVLGGQTQRLLSRPGRGEGGMFAQILKYLRSTHLSPSYLGSPVPSQAAYGSSSFSAF